jgi:hypothetical protein
MEHFSSALTILYVPVGTRFRHFEAFVRDLHTQILWSQDLGLCPEANEPSLDLPQIRNLEREADQGVSSLLMAS